MLYADALGVIHPLLSAESIEAWRPRGYSVGGVVLKATAYASPVWVETLMRVLVAFGALIFIQHVPLLWTIGANMGTPCSRGTPLAGWCPRTLSSTPSAC